MGNPRRLFLTQELSWMIHEWAVFTLARACLQAGPADDPDGSRARAPRDRVPRVADLSLVDDGPDDVTARVRATATAVRSDGAQATAQRLISQRR